MCEPVSMSTLMMASLAMSVASTAAATVGQVQQYNQNQSSAEQAFRIKSQQTNMALQQQQESDAMSMQDTSREGLKARATALASAGQSGTGGNSVDALVGDYHAAEGRFRSNIAVQNNWNAAQAALQQKGFASEAQSRINQVAKPTFIGAALRIGGEALDHYTQIYGTTPRAPGR